MFKSADRTTEDESAGAFGTDNDSVAAGNQRVDFTSQTAQVAEITANSTKTSQNQANNENSLALTSDQEIAPEILEPLLQTEV